MTFREIHDLEWCRVGDPHITKRSSIYSTAQKNGLRYERAVEIALSKLMQSLVGVRVEFQLPLHYSDINGAGLGIADFLIHFKDLTVVGETKLTWTPEAPEKLKKFYLQLIMNLKSSVKVRGLVICKNMVPEAITDYPDQCPVLMNLSDLFRYQKATIFTLPWRGKRPITW